MNDPPNYNDISKKMSKGDDNNDVLPTYSSFISRFRNSNRIVNQQTSVLSTNNDTKRDLIKIFLISLCLLVILAILVTIPFLYFLICEFVNRHVTFLLLLLCQLKISSNRNCFNSQRKS
jgi:hypothetical protein